jgi:hypothetical protein
VVDGAGGTLGNLIVGGTTDGGQRLQVMGDAFIKGSGATSATIGLLVQNSAGNQSLSVNNARFTTIYGLTTPQTILTDGNGALTISTGNFATIIDAGIGNNTNGGIQIISTGGINANFGGAKSMLDIVPSWTTTSANLGRLIGIRYAPTINQTGSATGITRGVYIEPTITAAADWRSIEWSNNSGWGLYGAGTANNLLNGDLYFGNDKGLVIQTSGTNRNISIKAGVVADNFANAIFYPSSGTNVASTFTVSPRGTGFSSSIKSQITVFNTDYVADSVNYDLAVLRAGGTNISLSTGKSGTGTTRPLLLSAGFATDGATNGNQLWLYTTGNVGINTLSDGGQRLQVQGTTLLNGGTSVTGSVTAISNNGRGVFMQQTLVASANGDFLTALLVTPTFTLGAFTGVTTLAARFDGDVFTNGGHTIANKLSLSAGTTARSQINLASSTAPTSPNNGDIWFDGTDLKMRIGGVTKTFTLV